MTHTNPSHLALYNPFNPFNPLNPFSPRDFGPESFYVFELYLGMPECLQKILPFYFAGCLLGALLVGPFSVAHYYWFIEIGDYPKVDKFLRFYAFYLLMGILIFRTHYSNYWFFVIVG